VRFREVWAVLKWKKYYDPRFDIESPDISVEFFDKREDALSYAKLMEEGGYTCVVFKALKS